MAKQEGQKLKLLYLKQYLEDFSDADHPVSVQEIADFLAEHNIHAERKSIYDDILCLQDFGMDIIHKAGRNGGYYLDSREFELPELKLLVDAVQSSRFLTTRKSTQLIEKLGHMASIYDAGSLKRSLTVTGQVKTMNESIYYNVDHLQEAISANSKIRFRYFELGVDRQKHFRPGPYEASPYTLVWDNENYYLVAHSERHGMTHYRVDKMTDIQSTGEPRYLAPEAQKPRAFSYGRNVFGMFTGETTSVRMRFHRSLAGVVLDRFGKDTLLIPDGEDYFTFVMDIVISPLFLGWLAGFGDKASVISPQSVIDAYVALIRPSLEQYLPKP